MKTVLLLILVFYLAKSTFGLQCWTCNSKCGCLTPVAEQCPPETVCYTLKSLSNGDIVRKGCATDCLQANDNGKICESCEGDVCNSEQSLAPMSGLDECKDSGEARLGIRSYRPDIGSGTGYNPNGIGSGTGYNPNRVGSGTGYNPSGIGSGTGYNPNGIGSGTGYNPNGIGSGTGYNPNRIGSGTGYNPSGIGSGTGYNPNFPNNNPSTFPNNNPNPIGSGTGYGRPNGNYYPSGNVGQNPYSSNQYGGGQYGRNVDGPHIGHGTHPYNSADSVFNYKKMLAILISICFAFAL